MDVLGPELPGLVLRECVGDHVSYSHINTNQSGGGGPQWRVLPAA